MHGYARTTVSIAETTVHTATDSITIRTGPLSRPPADRSHTPGAESFAARSDSTAVVACGAEVLLLP
ncbi:hypothetical protein [Streptomyces sp. NPDC002994]|uniref:hypothetical protein n=1 Tax=Streptomyces sp. NPDC002994 TaxID=3154441 RepID=UPI0033AAF87C